MITFTQNILSLEKDEVNVCWIVENSSDYIVKDAVAYSNLFSHNFGSFGVGTIKSISFSVPISKINLLDSAVINCFQNNESVLIQSNTVEI